MNIPLLFLLAVLSIGTREASPHTALDQTAKVGRAIGQLHSARETVSLLPAPCSGCFSSYLVAQHQSTSKEEQTMEDYSLGLLTRRYMLATIFGVIGAWIGLVVLIIQTIISRRSSQRQLRAYVVCESGMIANVANPIPLFPGQPLPQTEARITNTAAGPGAWIQIKNTGQTPAFQVSHWGYICFRECPLNAALPAQLPATNRTTAILGPGIATIKLLELNPPLTQLQTADLRAGTGAVYVYGEITYRDAFRRNRSTNYRLMYHRIGGAIGVSTTLSFCDDGNDAS